MNKKYSIVNKILFAEKRILFFLAIAIGSLLFPKAIIAAERFAMKETQLLHSAKGREFLSYLVSCSMPEEMELTAIVDGKEHIFSGFMGLAPNWLEKGLNKSEKTVGVSLHSGKDKLFWQKSEGLPSCKRYRP